jgi:hypothetical protein
MPKGPKFCPQCGTPVAGKPQRCKQCGTIFDDRFLQPVKPAHPWHTIIAPETMIKGIGSVLGLCLLLLLITGSTSGDQLVASAAHHTMTGYARTGTSAMETAQQAEAQAQQAVQLFQEALSQTGVQNYSNIQAFSQRFSQDQSLLATARTAQQYIALVEDAQRYTQQLQVIETTYTEITHLGTMLTTLQTARLDTAALQTQYQIDQQQFNKAQHIPDFVKLNTLAAAQNQEAEIETIQAFPYTSKLQLQNFQAQISALKSYDVDVSQYEAELSAAQSMLAHATSIQKDLAFAQQVAVDLNAVQVPLLQGEAHYLVNQFHQEVNAWAKENPYMDRYNGQTYMLDDGYMNVGIGAKLDGDLAGASTADEYNIVITEANNDLFNLHMLEADYHDRTPYNQVHATDLQLLDHYHLQSGQVIVVSLVEQAMRVYQNGKLENAFYVTTGQPAKPALPGVWSVLSRQSPMMFTSGEPRNSPLWFPDTPIKYGIMYHYGGFFVHDAWWRTVFGPGTQFPHLDAGGTYYAQTGSHGCINLATTDAAWVYSHTNWNTTIVVY